MGVEKVRVEDVAVAGFSMRIVGIESGGALVV